MTPSDSPPRPPLSPAHEEAASDERAEHQRSHAPAPSSEEDGGNTQTLRTPSTAPEPFHRLHPLSLLFGIARLGKGFLLPAIVVLFLSRKGSWEVWLMVMFIPMTIIEIYRYITLRYRIEAGRLIIKQGLIFRSERHVPLSRVQNIDLVQNIFHRLLKVAEVRIETAGGSKPEASFKVLALDAVDQLRAQVFEGRRADANLAEGGTEGTGATAWPLAASRASADQSPDSPADSSVIEDRAFPAGITNTARELHRIPLIELIKLGLISNRGLALVFIVLGLGWEYDLFDRINFRQVLRFAHDETVTFGWMHITVLALVAFILLRILSVSWVILRFYDYRLERSGDDFRLTCGLFTRVTATVPRRRIQLVSIHQTLLQRLLKRASMRIETAGGGGGGNDGERDTHAAISRRWFVPTIPMAHVPRVLAEIRDDLAADCEAARWESLAPKARRRMMSKAVKWSLVLVVILAAIFRPWGALAALIIIPLALWQAHREARFLSCARTARGLLFRSGAWTRRVSATFVNKIQTVTLRESPFDRRWRMATLCIDTAGAGPAAHIIRVRYLPPETAKTLADDLAANAESAEFRW